MTKILDELAKIAGSAIDGATSVKDGLVTHIEAIVDKMKLVSRKEFEMLKEKVAELSAASKKQSKKKMTAKTSTKSK
jgi:BMFP domain-containing protein YqiC